MSIYVAIVTGPELLFSRRSPGIKLPEPTLPDEVLALLSPEMKFLIALSQLTVEGWGATSVLAGPNSVSPLAVPVNPLGTAGPDVEECGTSATPAC